MLRTPRWAGPLLALLAAIALGEVVARQPPQAPDQTLLKALATTMNEPLQELMVWVYRVTGKTIQPLLVGAVMAWLAWKARWRDLTLVLLSCGGIYVLIDHVLKPWFNRARPAQALLSIDGSSFPSGHAAGAVVFSVVLALIVSRHQRHRRPLLLLMSGGWISLVSLSALSVRAHWPSDILGGWLVGAAGLGLSLAVLNQRDF
jgi:undecaprenyl-diphosphatase